MLFNINRAVRIRLNDYGREIHFRQWQAIMPHMPYRPPKEDENGWSKWQLWDLMNQFGAHVGLGMRLPFDAAIEIPDPVKEQADD